jgi:uncharacterized membrane protein
MWTIITLYLLLLVVYAAWDTVMFTMAGKRLYSTYYSNGITRYWAAALVYLLYPLAIVYLTRDTSLRETIKKAAVLGVTGYGLYHLTNLATLKTWPVDSPATTQGWPYGIVVLDTFSGAVVTILMATLRWYLTQP